jgi:hypothetical protein
MWRWSAVYAILERLERTYHAASLALGTRLRAVVSCSVLCTHCAEPGWRNWQTQRTQNPPRATSWGFDPPSRHQSNQ